MLFFLWKEHVSWHFVFHYPRADFDRFRFKICFYELSPYNFWVSTYLHTFKSLPSFVTNYEILIGTQMKIFCLRTTTKLFLELYAMVASIRSKNCFVHQKPSTFVQKSTIESVHVCNMPVCLSMDFLIYERNCYIWDSHMSRTF